MLLCKNEFACHPCKIENPQVATNVVNPMLPAPSPSHHHVDGWDFNHLQTVTLWHWTALYMLSLLETNKDVENSPFVDHVPCDLCSPIGFSTSFWSSLPQGLHCSSGTKENKLAGGGRQVDAASMFDAYAHPTISTLALDWGQDCGENLAGAVGVTFMGVKPW